MTSITRYTIVRALLTFVGCFAVLYLGNWMHVHPAWILIGTVVVGLVMGMHRDPHPSRPPGND